VEYLRARGANRAHNSAVECVLHTDEVAGSSPAAPTTAPLVFGWFVNLAVRFVLAVTSCPSLGVAREGVRSSRRRAPVRSSSRLLARACTRRGTTRGPTLERPARLRRGAPRFVGRRSQVPLAPARRAVPSARAVSLDMLARLCSDIGSRVVVPPDGFELLHRGNPGHYGRIALPADFRRRDAASVAGHAQVKGIDRGERHVRTNTVRTVSVKPRVARVRSRRACVDPRRA
jgi:hypothetical protein